jgi:hypothetical protein
MTAADALRYDCAEYLDSQWSRDGLWDQSAQLWLIEPSTRAEEQPAIGFLQIGRPGVDGIGFGYRAGQSGLWAYHPLEQRFQWLAPTLAALVAGWQAGRISV